MSLFRVLVVNAHSPTASGSKKFLSFVSHVRHAFLRQPGADKDNVKLIVRDLFSLQDHVFDPNQQGFPDLLGPRRFDALDFIFVTGDHCVLPWHPRSRYLILLLRMALKTRKFVFACGPAMRALGHICHTRWFSIVDTPATLDREELKTSQDSRQAGARNVELVTLLARDTGDVYHFQQNCVVGPAELQSVRPAGFVATVNYGMRHVSAYPPVSSDGQQHHSDTDADLVRLRPECGNHYLFRGLATRFLRVGKTRHRWRLFARQASEQERGYAILAETLEEPQVIQSEFCVGIQFAVDSAFPETLTMLDNFVSRHSELLMENGRITYMIHEDMSILLDPSHQPSYVPLFRSSLSQTDYAEREQKTFESPADLRVHRLELEKAAGRLGLHPEELQSMTPTQWEWVFSKFASFSEEQILRLRAPLRVPVRPAPQQSSNVASRSSLITTSSIGLYAWPNYNRKSATPMIVSEIPGVRPTAKSMGLRAASDAKLQKLRQTSSETHTQAGLLVEKRGKPAKHLLPASTVALLEQSRRFSSSRLRTLQNHWQTRQDSGRHGTQTDKQADQEVEHITASLRLPSRSWAIRSMLQSAVQTHNAETADFVTTLEAKYPSLRLSGATGPPVSMPNGRRSQSGSHSAAAFNDRDTDFEASRRSVQAIRRVLHGDRQERNTSTKSRGGLSESASRRSLALSRSMQSMANMEPPRRRMIKPYVGALQHSLGTTSSRLMDCRKTRDRDLTSDLP